MRARIKSRVSVGAKQSGARLWLAAAVLAAAVLVSASTSAAQFGDPMNPTQNLGVRPELLKDVGIDQ
ncbi:MAG: hypothetical protein ABR973_11170, partial [Candidatus Acidiferrales bacterium]